MSSTQSNPVVPTDADTLSAGTMLRRAREARGESLEEVVAALKLSMRQLVAIEDGHYEELPGPAFVRGFVRNYARHLGLDPQVVLNAVGADASATVDLTPLSNAEGDMPANRGMRFNPVPAAVVAGLLLVLISAGGYFGWFETPTSAEIEAVSPSMAPDVAVDDERAGEPPVGDAVVLPAAGSEAPLSATPAPDPAATPAPVTPSVVAPAAVAEPAPVAAPALVPSVEQVPPLRFAFSSESWIEVKDASGSIVYSGIGVAGSTREVQGTPPFALVIGNARNVRLEFNGKPVDLVPHTKVSVARLTVK